MVRRHGWQLPAHTLQVVAITVFFLLVIAFYAFFAPFLGKRIFEYVAIAVYTPLAITVFILYVRCTRINPADPGIMSKFENEQADGPRNTTRLPNSSLPNGAASGQASPLSAHTSSHDGSSNKYHLDGGDGNADIPVHASVKSPSCCFKLGGAFCAIFAKEDCRKEDIIDQEAEGDDALFCTLCNAEVRKFSKHCRSCDKCVDGFDHHCRWLNNCVGRKNYVSFISLMATSLVWLAIEFGVGVAVLVLCFVNKKGTESNIVDKLGNGFSRAPFATIVAICTAVSLLACVPLGELFFFHMILIKKGITTYEYVVAMRSLTEGPPPSYADEAFNNAIAASPTNSVTTGFSGTSSLGLQYKGVWCTPPRVFVDQQDEVIPHLEPGRVPSTVDPDASEHMERVNKSKKNVKISAWKLAKLDSNEAMKAAAKARASSSVLRPVEGRRVPDADYSSSGNASVRSSMSMDYSANKDIKSDLKLSPLRNSCPQSIASRDDYETGTPTGSSLSSPGRISEPVVLSPLPVQRGPPDRPVTARGPPPTTQLTNPIFQTASSLIRDTRRASVVWDQEAGRYISVPTSSRPETFTGAPGRTSRMSLTNPSGSSNVYAGRPNNNNPSLVPPPMQQSERFLYTGQSIFFGGPLINVRQESDARRTENWREPNYSTSGVGSQKHPSTSK